jgi:uncharacterized protein (TIGR02246 family)
MKKLVLASAISLLFGSASFADSKADLTEKLLGLENALCGAVLAQDEEIFNELVAEDAVIVEEGRVSLARGEGFKFHVSEVKIESFALRDAQVKMVSDDVAILSVIANAIAYRGDEKLHSTHHVSTTWALQENGNWMVEHSTSYPLPES